MNKNEEVYLGVIAILVLLLLGQIFYLPYLRKQSEKYNDVQFKMATKLCDNTKLVFLLKNNVNDVTKFDFEECLKGKQATLSEYSLDQLEEMLNRNK